MWWNHSKTQETPLPGAYRIGSFLDDLQKQPGTYRFRDSSRVKSASHQRFARCGEALLPGAYEQSDFVSDLAQQPKTYSFKNIKRGQEIKIGHGYGDKVWITPWHIRWLMITMYMQMLRTQMNIIINTIIYAMHTYTITGTFLPLIILLLNTIIIMELATAQNVLLFSL